MGICRALGKLALEPGRITELCKFPEQSTLSLASAITTSQGVLVVDMECEVKYDAGFQDPRMEVREMESAAGLISFLEGADLAGVGVLVINRISSFISGTCGERQYAQLQERLNSLWGAVYRHPGLAIVVVNEYRLHWSRARGALYIPRHHQYLMRMVTRCLLLFGSGGRELFIEVVE